MAENKKCPWCGIDFEPRDKRQKHCSKRCGERMRYEKRKGAIPLRYCCICGSPIKARGEHRKTCGKKTCISEQRKRYKLKINSDLSEGMSVDEVRAFFGMRKISVGEIRCLGCDRIFYSENTTTNKMCSTCNEQATRYYNTESYGAGHKQHYT
jgi:predicted nucleic acid-binding Zn ribbon protein